MRVEKRSLIYSGKAKSIYQTEQADVCIMEFRDDTTAFDGVKKASLMNKGRVSNAFNAYVMQYLEQAGVTTHFIKKLNDTESLVKQLDMIRVECVVRNIAAGSICKRLGLEEGKLLPQPILEFFLKDDALHDPMINESHIIVFNWASAEEIEQMKVLTLKVNEILQPLFAEKIMCLVDFKLEFGRADQQLVLGDEFTPDGCRIWDANTREKLDKDRFRRDLGNVIEGYQEVAQRFNIVI